MKSNFKSLFIALSAFISLTCKSQSCESCSITVNSLDSTVYTLNVGQTLCIDTTGIFIGTINLNGGVICNKGIFNPMVISIISGEINNYSNVSIKSGITISETLILNNKPDAIMNILGNLTIGGGTISNNGIINVDQNIQYNSGVFINSNVINCAQLTGSGTVNNSGIINHN